MSLPHDINDIEINVTSYGKTLWEEDYPVGANGDVEIPATLGVVGDPGNPGAPVEIQVIAKNTNLAGGTTGPASYRVLRDITTTVPDGRTALLRMPIEWLCWEVNTGSVADGGAPSEQSCPFGQTCIAGSCKPGAIDSDDLEPFDPSVVFGGSTTPASGTCFETLGCFGPQSAAVSVTIDPSNCSIPAPANAGTGINVALVRASRGADSSGVGVCNDNVCYVPLDQDPNEGWSLSGGQILLPPAVCQDLATASPAPPTNKLIQGVEITTACPTKTPSIPTCGAWSSVGTAAANGVITDGGSSATSPGGCIVGTWTQTGGGNSCNGETQNNTIDVTYDNGQYLVSLTAGPFDNGSGGCETLNDQNVPASASAGPIAGEAGEPTLTFDPSLSQVCSCSSAAVSVTLSVSADCQTLSAVENFSGVTQCPSGQTGAPESSDAGRLTADDAGSGSGSSGGTSSGTSSSGGTSEDSGSGNDTNFCATCGDVTCSVTATFSPVGGSSSGGADASVPANDGGSISTCEGVSCAPGFLCCGTGCTDLQTDPSNCGNCGNDCNGGTCEAGQCQGGTKGGGDGGTECGPGNCNGCCQGTACFPLSAENANACGVNGDPCTVCGGGDLATCNGGVCGEQAGADGG
jgi:hypothetical protein